MNTKTKIGIIALIIASFVIGGFAFNAYRVGAAENGNGHKFGCFGGGFRGFSGIDKDSPEWQAKMEEFKANRTENGEWKGRGLRFGHLLGFKGLKGLADKVDYKIENIANGVQITITSDDPDIVQKLQESAARYNNLNE